MGLSETTHFTNCVGIYNDDHYSTPYDMAMILKAAMDNDLCREVLGTRTYTTSKSKPHPDGITISSWFLRRIEDKDTHSEIIGAKTGFRISPEAVRQVWHRHRMERVYLCDCRVHQQLALYL